MGRLPLIGGEEDAFEVALGSGELLDVAAIRHKSGAVGHCGGERAIPFPSRVNGGGRRRDGRHRSHRLRR